MNGLNIAENIIRLRHEREITQEKLAAFIGVTKASVSKWESGKSTPDVLLLPQLAAFFGVTVDELIGYEAQLSREQTRKIYGELCEAFVKLPFQKALEEARAFAHRYYSCYQFLLRIGILYLNHAMLAGTEEECRNVLREADTFCDHILARCRDASICEDAVSLKAVLYIQLGKTGDAVAILEGMADPSRLSGQNDLMLVQAYCQAGETGKAKSYTQIWIYTYLLSIVSAEAMFLFLYEKEPERCEETIRRVKGIMELYHLDALLPNQASQFYYQAAALYAVNGKNQEALTELEGFAKCICTILDSTGNLLHGDDYFDRLEEWIDRLPLGDMMPRDKSFIRQSALQIFEQPAFSALKETEEFKKIYSRIAKGGEKDA